MKSIPVSVERTKPHILILGDVQDTELQEYFDSLGSGVGYAQTPQEVRQSDFDFVIDLGELWAQDFDGNTTVLRFEDAPSTGLLARIGESRTTDFGFSVYPGVIERTDGGRASEFLVPENSDSRFDFRSLISESILPNIHRGGDYTTLQVHGEVVHNMRPLLKEKDGSAIAAIIDIQGHNSYWSLPAETSHRLQWIQLFVAYMRAIRPDAFPPEDIELPVEWYTLAELRAERAIEKHQAETQALLAERYLQLETLKEELEHATQKAEEQERLLLTAQGDLLTSRVTEVLRKFGFEVEDRDDVAAESQANKQEDLRLTHTSSVVSDWVCLVEVKGFSRGAKANVIQQVQKAAGVFIGQEDREPSALWYVVNHHLNEPPHTRPEVLRSNPDEVQAFSKANGLVIDTRWLFQLEKRLDAGEITAEMAATDLMSQKGIFTPTAAGEEELDLHESDYDM